MTDNGADYKLIRQELAGIRTDVDNLERLHGNLFEKNNAQDRALQAVELKVEYNRETLYELRDKVTEIVLDISNRSTKIYEKLSQMEKHSERIYQRADVQAPYNRAILWATGVIITSLLSGMGFLVFHTMTGK
jgi:chromosome segregation ATPase